MKRVHLVFDAEILEALAEVIMVKGIAEVTGKDFTIDMAAQWARSGKGEDPDIILIDGTVEISKVDTKTGKVTRDRLFITRLREIRSGRPNSQVIVLLQEDRSRDIGFLQALTGLAIFDIYFISTFNEEQLRQWFETRKNFADVQHLLPGAILEDTELSEQKSNYLKEKEEAPDEESAKGGILNKLINVRKKPNPKDNMKFKTQKLKQARENDINIKSVNPTVILGLGNQNLDEWFKNTFSHTAKIVLAASSTEEFRTAVQEKCPDIVVIMRAGPTGGLPYADELAVFACQYVRHVIFIAGELDDEGKVMAEAVKNAGGKVLSCPPGETISGEELVLLIQNTIDETVENTHSNESEKIRERARNSSETLMQGISQVTDIFKKAIQRPSRDNNKAETEELPIINTARIPKHPSAITAGGVLLVASPWRPGLAGRITAQAARTFSEGGSNVAVICASGRSTAAAWLGVTDEELIMSDWRVPGSQTPVDRGNIKIWAVDPAKSLHMNIKEDMPYILNEARNKADYTVIDFGEDIDLAQSYIHQKEAVLLCLIPGSDPVEQKTSLLWLKRTLGQKDNIVIGFDLREQGQIPEGVASKLTITTSPEEALQNALKKNMDQYLWNKVIK